MGSARLASWPCQKDGRTVPTLNAACGIRTMCIARSVLCLFVTRSVLASSTEYSYYYHILVERDEQLSKFSNFYTNLCLTRMLWMTTLEFRNALLGLIHKKSRVLVISEGEEVKHNTGP